MADVFLSYVRDDKARVAPLVAILRAEGFDVWWDDDIPPGAPWESTIEQALFNAKAVIVCWSAGAVASENVRSEARWARTKGRLFQIFLDQCEPPLFFGERQGVDLSRWTGARDATEVARLAASLRDMLSAAPEAAATSAPTPPVASVGRRSRPWIWIAFAAVAVLAAVVAALVLRPGAAPPRGTRVAVLPFDVLSKDDVARTFAAALTDQIVTGLNSSEMPALSRSDALALRGSDKTDRLKALGIALEFDGTVGSDGRTMTVQVHVNDPFQHVAIWSSTDHENAGKLDALRDRITRTVVGVLACSNRALKENGLTDPALLGRYLRACDLFVNHGDARDHKAAFELLDNLRIVARQAPEFVPAHTDLAKFDAYLAPLFPPEQAAAMRAESAAEAALSLKLQPKSPDAYLAQQMLLPPTDWAKREALLRKGVATDPDWPHTNGFLGQFLSETGRMREATVFLAHAAAADLQIDWRPAAARAICNAGDFDSTIDDLKSRLVAQQGDKRLIGILGGCLEDAGRFAEARALWPVAPGAQAASVPTGVSVSDAVLTAMISKNKAEVDAARRQALAFAATARSPYDLGVAMQSLSQLGFVDDAFAIGRRYRPGYSMTGIVAFLFGPRTAAMRADPRFMRLAASYGLVDFWRTTGHWPDFCADPTLPYNCKAEAARDLAAK